MLYKEYDEKTLKKLQTLELEILQDFITLCQEHHIDYFGVGGIAIGALRHSGFIPWDDDIDIGLTRKNYEKFLKAAKDYKPEKYRIINARTEPNYPLTTTRWALRGTRFKEDCYKDLDCDLGIFLDIYCFDNMADTEWKAKIQGWTAWFYNKLMILKAIPDPVLYFDGWKADLTLAVCRLAHKILNILPVSNQFLYRKAEQNAAKYRKIRTKRVNYFFDPTPFLSVCDRDTIEPTREIAFEGMQVAFPGKVEKYLERRYGDYMTLPPEEKRHNHPPYELDFGPYEKEADPDAGL
ncbi:MAG: LicD family protein [Eubacteriales bacterium]|nr:LicD family protein [Eubacteriales bacterium]